MRAYTHWKWHLDEVYVKINGELHYLRTAVDHKDEVLECFVTKTRDKAAALKFIKRATKRHGKPEAIVTDGLRSYSATIKEIGNHDRQEGGRWRDNRAENSHEPFQPGERAIERFRRMKTLQKFSSFHAPSTISSIRNVTSSAGNTKERRSPELAEWRAVMS